MLNRIALFVTGCLCVGCSTQTSMVPLAGLAPQRPSLCVAAVKVFASPAAVQSQFTELAIFTAHSSWSDENGLVATLREKAAAVGANAIIVGEFKRLTESHENSIQATAIWVPTDSVRARAACETGGPPSRP